MRFYIKYDENQNRVLIETTEELTDAALTQLTEDEYAALVGEYEVLDE